jgi:hypothetical protein
MSETPRRGDQETMTVYVSIGNSDDKLTQAEWSHFCAAVDALLAHFTFQRHGVWFSLPTSAYQNACWLIEVKSEYEADIRRGLRDLAGEFRQDSIAWAEATTELLTPWPKR